MKTEPYKPHRLADIREHFSTDACLPTLLAIFCFVVLALCLCLSGCAAQKNAFRSDFDSVSVNGSYGSPDGQTVGAGIKLGVRPPDRSK